MAIERFEDLVRRGHQVIVLTAGVPGFPSHEIKNGLQIIRSPILHPSRAGQGVRRLLFPLWVSRRLQKIKPDVVHFSGTGGIGPFSSNLGSLMVNQVAQRLGARTLWVHSLADSKDEAFSTRGLDHRLRNIFLARVDTIVSVSPALHNSVARVFPGKATLILYGVHNDFIRPLPVAERSQQRSRLGVNEQEVIFLFVGSVGRRKGFDVLANAFAELSPKYPNWHLWVIGPRTVQENQNIDPQEVARVSAPLDQLKNKVRYWGRLDDRQQLALLLSLADIFVFPTLREGMPISPIEAMAAGTPVIITLLPGVTDVAPVEGQTGLFITPGDPESLIAAMITLGEQPELRLRMGTAAMQRVKNEFSWQPYIDRWENVYQGKGSKNPRVEV